MCVWAQGAAFSQTRLKVADVVLISRFKCHFPTQALQLDVAALNVTAFAFARAERGSYGIVLVNMGSAARSVVIGGPWAASPSATTYTLTAAAGNADAPHSATAFAYNGVTGAAKGGPFPAAGLDSMPPKQGAFTGTVELASASVTGIIISSTGAL